MTDYSGATTLVYSIDSLLSSLPDEGDDNYTIILKEIVLKNGLIARENDLEAYLNSTSATNQFAAFYALLIICREYNNYSKYNSYVERYAGNFTQYGLYKIIISTYYRNRAILGERDAFSRAIRYAEEACEKLPTNLAVKHHYAAIIVLAIEEKIEVTPDTIGKAIEKLDDVIFAFPEHALYYSTQGRLFAAIGDFQRGAVNLKKALDLENGVDKDSMIRIGEYNFYLLQIKMMMENEHVDKKMSEFNNIFQEMERSLDSVKTQYLEYLAFFSSVLAFILTSINIINKIDDFNKCAGIILMFAGAMIMAFGVFRMLLYFSTNIRFSFFKIAFCYMIGIMLLVVGFLIGNQTVEQYINNIFNL